MGKSRYPQASPKRMLQSFREPPFPSPVKASLNVLIELSDRALTGNQQGLPDYRLIPARTSRGYRAAPPESNALRLHRVNVRVGRKELVGSYLLFRAISLPRLLPTTASAEPLPVSLIENPQAYPQFCEKPSTDSADRAHPPAELSEKAHGTRQTGPAS
jgi:hypothetical protein